MLRCLSVQASSSVLIRLFRLIELRAPQRSERFNSPTVLQYTGLYRTNRLLNAELLEAKPYVCGWQ